MGDGLSTRLVIGTPEAPLNSIERFFSHANHLRSSILPFARSLAASVATAASGYAFPEGAIDYQTKVFYRKAVKIFENAAGLAGDFSGEMAHHRNLAYYKALSLLDPLAPAGELKYAQIVANLRGYLEEERLSYLVTSTALFFLGNVVWEFESRDRTAKVVNNAHAHLAEFIKKAGFKVQNSQTGS